MTIPKPYGFLLVSTLGLGGLLVSAFHINWISDLLGGCAMLVYFVYIVATEK